MASLNYTENQTFSENETESTNGTLHGAYSMSLLELLEDNTYYQQAMNLITYGLPVIILIGTIGNVLSFQILIQREMRQTSTFFYLAALAVVDTLVLYVSAFKTWIRTITDFEMLHVSDAACKILIFITHFSVHFSAWLIVAVTIERFLAVWFPLKATTMCSLSRAKFVTLMIAVIFALVNAHLFWTAELLPAPNSINKDKLICAAYAYQNFVCKIFPWINLVLYSFLPVSILFVFNLLIIYSLAKNKPVSSMLTKDDRNIRNNHRKLAATLVVISFTWIVTTIPRPLHQLLVSKPNSINEYAELMLGRVICFYLMYINHAVNFFIYGLTGQRFRMELMKFVCRLSRKNKKPKPRLTFKSSGSGSGQESSFPLVTSPFTEMATFA